MIALDTGVLALALNRYAPEHPRASRVLERLVNGPSPWAMPWPVLHEFLHVVSHPHAVARPVSRGDALAFVEQVLRSPSVQALGPGPAYREALGEVIGGLEPGGGLPRGFETAVILREHGVREILSTDRGMQRYGFLTVIDPLREESWSPADHPTRRYRKLRAAGAR